MIINDSTAGLGCQAKKAVRRGVRWPSHTRPAVERSFSSSIVPRPSSLRSQCAHWLWQSAPASKLPSLVFCLPSPVIAKPRRGCGNPYPPSKPPSLVPRPSSSVFRLPSSVPRKLRGISRGPQPPGRWGRIPKGTAFGIGSLWRVFAYFLHGRESRPPEATGRNCKWQRQTANPN